MPESITLPGKILPQALEIEEAVLGTCLIDRGAFDTVSEILTAECFYSTGHQRIFEAMVRLASRNQRIDYMLVKEEVEKMGELENIGGSWMVDKLTLSANLTANLITHARLILEKFMAREMIAVGSEMIAGGYDPTRDVFDLLDEGENRLFSITSRVHKTEYLTMNDVLVQTIQRIEELRNRKSQLTGVPSGFKGIDRLTSGWQQTDLIILAARPSVGKTAFALNLAKNAACHADQPTGVLFFSLEMSARQLVNRLLSSKTEIPLEKIRDANLDDSDMRILYQDGIAKLSDCPLYIDDSASLNMFQIRGKARRAVSRHKVGMIIIDYLQLISGNTKSGNREQEISQISRQLKQLAKELNIPVIALSQLSREVEKRSGKLPQLSDLRESGAIEQDADVVAFLYRPGEDEIKSDASLQDTGQVMFKKHRNGSLADITLRVRMSIQTWMDLDQYTGPAAAGWKPLPSGTIPRDYTQPASMGIDTEDEPF